MNNFDQSPWNQIVAEIKKQIAPQDFSLWIKDIVLISESKQVISLSVDSLFSKENIMKKYEPLFQSIGKQLFNTDYTFSIAVDSARHDKKQSQDVRKTHSDRIQISSRRAAHPSPPTQFNPEYTFENFVVGDNSTFAYNAAIAISESPGADYNPCLIYGSVGLGKTHILHAIGNRISVTYPNLKVIIVTSETYLSEFILSVRNNNTKAFKNKYRHADVLLIDDIQFLQGKKETQLELFHTFNALYEAQKHMVFTSDRPISAISDISDRLKNRFERGLNVDLTPPSFETRVAIIEKKIERREPRCVVSQEIINHIAESISSNVRDLEAAITKIIAYSELINGEITMEMVKKQLHGYTSSTAMPDISVRHIQKIVAHYFETTVNELIGKKRTTTIALARQIAIYLSKKLTRLSFVELGTEYNKNHTTIIHANKTIIERMKIDSDLLKQIEQITNQIYSTHLAL